MKVPEVIVVGWIRKGKLANCGETMKNQLMIRKLEEMGVKCRQMDFKDWKRHPWIFIQLLWNIVVHRDNTLIFSTSTQNVYQFMRVLNFIKWKQNTVHWVIGGSLGDRVVQKIYKADVVGYMKHTLVESNKMLCQMEECGIKGLKHVPNFKPITYYPEITKLNKPLRFVFLSRIMPEKGCNYILEAARQLNEYGLKDKFIIDFYGNVADTYKDEFEEKLRSLENVRYAGFLNLRENAGYDKLASYDLMLFPTYWKGEGFAGIFIDTFIAGVPIIASEWAHNREFLEEGKTALFVPVHDANALAERMKECIEGKYDIDQMKLSCQKESEKYNVDNVITKDLLKEIEIF